MPETRFVRDICLGKKFITSVFGLLSKTDRVVFLGKRSDQRERFSPLAFLVTFLLSLFIKLIKLRRVFLNFAQNAPDCFVFLDFTFLSN